MYKLILVALLVAAPAFAQEQAADLRSAAGCGSTKTQFGVKTDKSKHSVAQPEPGKALVYVVEGVISAPHLWSIGHTTTRVGVDGSWVGANQESSYLSFAVEPGTHRVCSDVQSVFVSAEKMSAAADLMAEAGKTYYYRVMVTVGDQERQAHVSVKPVDEAEGLLLISKSALSASKPKK
jgi:hypothetical protein